MLPANGPAGRGALLRLHGEMFANARARDRETIRAFEAFVLGFLPRVELAAIAALARFVAPCPDTPAAVLVALAQRSPEARAIIAAGAPRLPVEVRDLLLGSPHDRLHLAARPDLDDADIERLLVLDEEAVDIALAGHPALVPQHPALPTLVARARHRAPLARALLARTDLALADEAALYLQADAERRAQIRDRVAASALFQRPQAAPRLSGAAVEQLLALARAGHVAAFENGLSAALGLPHDTAWQVLKAGRHELLALALVALGVDAEDATRIFLTLHPAVSHSVEAVFGLVRVTRQVARPTALALVEAALGLRIGAERAGRHVPAWDPSVAPARAGGLLPADHGRASADERRQRAG